MTTIALSDFCRRFRRSISAMMLRERSDQQLVEMFLGGHDPSAMEAIVCRHGPMVLRVCWRILQHSQDAEDAFQATFLMLAKEVRALRKHASLAGWLHAVARRIALKCKNRSALRRFHEQRSSQRMTMPCHEATWGELFMALDVELARLPDKWKLPLVLCYLESRTQDEAARQLGWSKRTLARRLEEARIALGNRLKGRGLALPTALTALLVSDCTASAAPMPRLVASTVEAALRVFSGQALSAVGVSPAVASLTRGGTMQAKKTLALALLIGTVVMGAGISGEIQIAHRPTMQVSAPQQNSQTARRQTDAKVRQTLDQAFKAHGGEQALQKLKFLSIGSKRTYHGQKQFDVIGDNEAILSIVGGGNALDFETLFNHDEQYKEVGPLTTVFNGNEVWRASMFDGNLFVGKLADREDQEIISWAKRELYADMVTRLYALNDRSRGFDFRFLGEIQDDGRVVVGVRVRCKNQPDIDLYFDKTSNLLVKATYFGENIKGQQIEVEKRFSNFRELIPGIKVSTRIAIREGDEKYDVEIVHMRHVQRHPAEVFARPKE